MPRTKKNKKSLKSPKSPNRAVGSRRQVLSGKADHTSGGLKKNKLVRSVSGRIVSRAAKAMGEDNPWIKAVKKARANLNRSKMGINFNAVFPTKTGDAKSAGKVLYVESMKHHLFFKALRKSKIDKKAAQKLKAQRAQQARLIKGYKGYKNK